MRAYCFFSVHEETFHRIAERLRGYGTTSFAGFVWGHNQVRAIADRGIDYDLVVFTRDLLPMCNDGATPDLGWLDLRERELGVSIQRMLASERHLLAGRSFDQIMRLAEVGLREIASAYDRIRPDFVFTEDISCFHSYAHFVLARERGIPFWCIGHGRLRGRIAVYASGLQHWERVEHGYDQLRSRGLSASERAEAERYCAGLREKPIPQRGNAVREDTSLDLASLARLRKVARDYFADRGNPTAVDPLRAIGQRLRRRARVRLAAARGVFEAPVAGEKYVLYPIHFQPEASTLVQAPLYVDQLALIQDIAKCLPVDHRLYVKEHVINKGRRPVAFYEAIRAVPAVRLLGPDEHTWPLVKNASVIAVITGTMGWEGVIFDKPVVTFGDIFYNLLPHVYRAGDAPKDRWYELFRRAATSHRPDRDALLALVAAMQQATYPGMLPNATRVPEVLSDDNISNVAAALATEVGLLQQRKATR